MMKMRNYLFFAVTVLLAVSVLWPLAMPLSVGLMLGFVSEGTIDSLCKLFRSKTENSRFVVSAAFVCVVTLLILFPLISSIVVSLFDLSKLLSSPNMGDSLSTENLLVLRERAFQWLSETLSTYGIDISIADIGRRIGSWAAEAVSYLAETLGSRIASTPWFTFQILLAMMAWTVFGAAGRRLREIALPHLIPWKKEREVICETVAKVVRSLFLASAAIAATQALAVTSILAVFGIPRFLMFGFLSFFVSFIPVVGTGLVLVPAALYLLTDGRWIAAIMVGCSTILIGLLDNFLRPMLMRGSVPLSFFWIFLAIIGGIVQFGLAGTVIGPVSFALFVAALKILREPPSDQCIQDPAEGPLP